MMDLILRGYEADFLIYFVIVSAMILENTLRDWFKKHFKFIS